MQVRQTILKRVAGFAAISSLIIAPGGIAAAPEAAHYRYTAAYLSGDYAIVVVYGANIAKGMGTESFDGHGNVTGAAFANQPGPGGTRTISHITISGSYQVNADGSGKRFLIIGLANGTSANVTEDFMITRAKIVDGVAIATDIVDVQEQASAVIDDQSLVTHTLTLILPPQSHAD
jgi:hypothetical protein